MTIELQDKQFFDLECVDPELTACDGNIPNSSVCQRLFSSPIAGDKDGSILDIIVF